MGQVVLIGQQKEGDARIVAVGEIGVLVHVVQQQAVELLHPGFNAAVEIGIALRGWALVVGHHLLRAGKSLR